MAPNVTPGKYKNTTTGVTFNLSVDGDTVNLTAMDGWEMEKDRTNFWFNVEMGNYELVEADEPEEPEKELELSQMPA